MTKYVVSSIWLLLLGGVVYFVSSKYPLSTVVYIFLCWMATAPLAGLLCVKAVDNMKNDGDGEYSLTALLILTIILGAIVSIIDFFFISNNFADYLCDLIEIGFGYLSILSYGFGKLFITHINAVASIVDEKKKKAELEREQERMREKELIRKHRKEIVLKVLKEGRDRLTESEEEIIQQYLQENYSDLMACLNFGSDEKEILQEILQKVQQQGESSLSKEQMQYYEKYQAAQKQKEIERIEREEKEKIARIKWEKAEKERKQLEEVEQYWTKLFIDAINEVLLDIINEGKELKEFCVYGGKGYEEKYYAREYPVSFLKSNTVRYVKKVARMTDRQIERECGSLALNNLKSIQQRNAQQQNFENRKKQKIFRVEDRDREILMFNHAGILTGGIRKHSNEKFLGFTSENVSTRCGEYRFTYNNLGERISEQFVGFSEK